MFGKLIGAFIGARAAKSQPGGLDGPSGALIGAAIPMILRRFGPLGLIAAAVGGYALKRYSEKPAKPAKRASRAAPRKRTRAKPAAA